MRACAAVSVVVIPSGKLARSIRFKYDVTVFIAEVEIRAKPSAVYRHKVPRQSGCLGILYGSHKLIIHFVRCNILDHNVYLNSFSITYA